ncbi:division/cell wall cluster transcriptional repressor MraZ [Thermofilum sp.]|uniref:MraZ C-terminal domain-containing protein n=1 Tax=Thermofilum TaxID=2268 RepID=UPI00069C7807
MSIVKVDRRGRITLPKKLRESLGIGEKVLIVNMGDHLQIIPPSRIHLKRLRVPLALTSHLKS